MTHILRAIVIGAALITGAIAAQAQTPQPSSRANWPADVDKQSGFRLPIPKREELDELGQRAYDRGTAPGATIAGLQGPAGIQLYSTGSAQFHSGLNNYLRRQSGISPRIREIAILTTAREFDSQFEWAAHEPEGLKEGVPPNVIDVIKHSKALDGLDPKDAIMIQFGRELWRNHKVTPATFAKAKETFGPKMLVDIVMFMGNYASTAGILAAFDMQLHEGTVPMLPVP